MSVINTNITAMIGQQNLSQSQNALSTSMERLSSGLKINSAADDAAGQAIANRMSSQINGLGQAQSNANDGISVAQTTEGALNQVNDNLQRVRELTVQAENGTNSQEDLDSIQDEIDARLGEIDRISEETSFNGVDVLAKDQEMDIQVGSEDGQTITMNLQEVNSETLNLDTFNVNGSPEAESSDVLSAATSGDTVTVSGGSGADTYTVDDSGNWTNSGGDAVSVSDIETAISEAGASGSTATITGASSGSYAISAEGDVTSGASAVYVEDDALTAAPETAATGTPLASLDSAISQVDSQRSELGAMQNRFDSAITNLSTTETNLSSARSRIEDADYADEVSNMTRNQILQQAGTSVLSQANQLPQNALSLLG
ncbi:FliC/FljB family flagellin [Chromohalobacter canadensis]|uniref:FliC/FljB family flagellin n=1 Tax=Chromohalobacter canadensis TaxID=141389 RepID=UPI0021C1007A|nr:FliC/FljB family flagellin [Chromohalobacter canadensis]MCT8469810.1 FliC/FljB family flagellin [Chromohalobacter canadensis]MCT8472355.1 FliC/FljB family flagellin [Chromohalobacter canadensis]MCT8499532.1 FliC/FljB family flagellin [Chromohalobacter canadensis]